MKRKITDCFKIHFAFERRSFDYLNIRVFTNQKMSFFQSSTDFKNQNKISLPFITRSVALNTVTRNPNWNIFELDKGPKCRMCIVCPWDTFILDYMEFSPSERFWNEMIFPEKPCKLFMDCERYNVQVTTEEFIKEFVDGIEDVIKIHIPNLPPPLVLNASRVGKFSIHIIWDVWFQSTLQCASFIKSRFEGNKDVDIGVYPKSDKPKTLRMPFNMKRDVNTAVLLPLGLFI